MSYDKLISAFYSNPSIGIEVADTNGRVIESNKAFCDFVCYEVTELYELRVYDLCHSEDKEQEFRYRNQLLAGGCEQLSYRKRFITKAGKIRWGDANTTLVRDSEGVPIALVSMIVDVTDQRRRQLLQEGQSLVLQKLYRKHPLESV